MERREKTGALNLKDEKVEDNEGEEVLNRVIGVVVVIEGSTAPANCAKARD